MKYFSTIATPFTEIVKKFVGFKWDYVQEKTFNMLKDKLCLTSILACQTLQKLLKLNVMPQV